jgi:auxin efflux carrier
MNLVSTVTYQVVIMFLLAGIGALMFRFGKISLEGSKSIGSILVNLSLPAVIINGFLVERTPERITGLLLSALLAAVTLALAILAAWVCFRKDPMAQFAAAFSNPGFFGIPIILSCLDNGTIFYIAAYVAFLNLLQWSYGVSLLTGATENITPKRLLTAPFVIAIEIGAFFFLTGFPVPGILAKAVTHLANLNTPLAMFATGVYLAQTDPKKMVRKAVLYKISVVKLLVVPLLAMVMLALLPKAYFDLKLTLLIAAACPTGTNIAVYAQLHDRDFGYAVETVAVTTILSLLTLPLVTQLAIVLW